MRSQIVVLAVVVVAVLAAGSAQADVFNMGDGQTSLQFVTVGDPGNAADQPRLPNDPTYYGSVPYVYRMGKYDVTVGQYCQFLNAVAQTDSYGLYSSKMATDYTTIKITQSGSLGNYSYSVTGGYSQGVNCPIFEVSWGDAARFCNWLRNGQPTGAEGSGTTETGAYTLNGATTNSALMAATRNTGATYFIPTEDEFYKAAYYKGGSANAGYWTYPTQSSTMPSNVLSQTGTNNANYSIFTSSDPTNCLTPVGAFTASPGPYGTYDQGGDVWQWNETADSSSTREMRGGDWNNESSAMATTSKFIGSVPSFEIYGTGFRVASLAVPEPGSIALLGVSAACALAFAWRRRK